MKTAQIFIKDTCLVEHLCKKVKRQMEKEMTFANPLYMNAMKHGRYSGGMNPTIHYYYKHKGDYSIPRGYIPRLEELLKKAEQKYIIDDCTTTFPEMSISFKGKLRLYQEIAVEAILESRFGVLEAATGSGKTVCAIGVIAKRKQPTLIIVHNKELLYQWQGAINKFLSYDCGIIGDGIYDVKEISVGIVNTVKNKTDELKDKFGQIICDETHRTPSTMWTESLIHFSSRFQLGLSATPYRRDGLGGAINIFVGPLRHIVSKKWLHSTGAVLKPKIIRVYTNFKFKYKGSYSVMLKNLTLDTNRNQLIVRKVIDDLKKNKENVLITSDRVIHCKELQDRLAAKGVKSELLTSAVPKKERKAIVQRIKEGKANVLIATLSLIGEGFDSPELAALFMATPVKWSGRLIQVIGRILRPSKGKKPRVYDFRDNGVGVLIAQGRSRDNTYKKEWGCK